MLFGVVCCVLFTACCLLFVVVRCLVFAVCCHVFVVESCVVWIVVLCWLAVAKNCCLVLVIV